MKLQTLHEAKYAAGKGSLEWFLQTFLESDDAEYHGDDFKQYYPKPGFKLYFSNGSEAYTVNLETTNGKNPKWRAAYNRDFDVTNLQDPRELSVVQLKTVWTGQ